ncbi:Fe(2+) transporter permease subunit FeoB [Thauera linaloolentis]|uniref:Ferrous iron transport protein B n=1 Tax=Thauera linaloolentis (strain DSM 12138 / JCM 21573 / CCUG 41526 / CIP 105981 / IAM 15112 / NBRC 102519 / 47Lol) TaxID=1123367 RepID=N6Z2M9_THAL4|nr:Fe(2+) transporter permease subunit FeoB [Thauera linaloolentis]ENO88633.1 ferrous iron transport protein B [Thauera linaloolentis 47Lol = DSM 12138]MCM8565678.1 Fe(2+) transporter permease subunit FeoB [Thauera linaloolentis]
MNNEYVIALVGNPNCGKTTLFNALTGSRQRVGNWPGVTVEKKSGEYRQDGLRFEVVDLPGTYSLDVVDREVSLDESVARDYVHAAEAGLIVNIVDAANLERNLYLTTQLAEMRVPLLVVLNMVDVARDKGLRIDVEALSRNLGCPVIPVVASEGEGIDALKAAIRDAVQARRPATAQVEYQPELEKALGMLVPRLEAAAQTVGTSPRWLAVRLLEGDDLARAAAGAPLAAEAQAHGAALGEDIDIMVADARYGLANRVAGQAVEVSGRVGRDMTDRIDRVVLNRALGIPIFLLMMYLMFLFTINIGGAFIDFFDQFTGALVVDGLAELLDGLGSPAWLTVLLAQGIGGGIQVVATFIPVIGFLFLFLSVLEDSGYMARAAFVMDRFMRWVGLPGKSFVPLIVGFGCTVPAIMATRTLEHRRDRLMTIAMAPFMSCGARLPVYVLFAAAFFPTGGQNVVFALYLIGIAVAVLTGLVLRNTLLKGEPTPFIMELPPYHLPTVKGVLRHAWDRLKGFIIRAGRVIVPMVLVLNVLNSVGTDGSYGNEDSDASVLAAVGRSITPAFAPMGLTEANWPAAVGIFTGVLAKEAVVGTLDAAYSALAVQDAGGEADEEEAFDLRESIAAAFATIPENLVEALGAWADPIGLDVGDLSDQWAVAEDQEVSTGTFGAMVARFDGAAGAFAYLLFILLYFPCTAATAAVFQESGARWTVFVVAWTTGLGYGLATLFYQAATWAQHPASSLAWIGGVVACFALALWSLRRYGARGDGDRLPLPQQV